MISIKKTSKLILILLVAFLMFPAYKIHQKITFNILKRSNLENIKVISNPAGKKVYILDDLSYSKTGATDISDIILSFDKDFHKLYKDDLNNYKIKYAQYKSAQIPGTIGKRCGKFYKSHDRIEIETAENLWLGSSGDLGSFTIEFRFLAQSLRDNSVIFSRIGYLSGKKRGIDIRIKNGRIVSNLFDLFLKPDNKREDVKLKIEKRILKGLWYHYLLSFDRISGKISVYLNEDEEDVKYLTEFDSPYAGVFIPLFGGKNNEKFISLDLPVAIIGKNFTGYIDEFRISYKNYRDLKKLQDIASSNFQKTKLIHRVPINSIGILKSPIYKFQFTGTDVSLFEWHEKLNKNTFLWFEFRISDDLFYENDMKPKWYRIRNHQRNIFRKRTNTPEKFLKGKYYQWRAYLHPSPDGKSSPELSNIKIEYKLNTPPDPPKFIEKVERGDKYITLKWRKNFQPDVLGYNIYYGIRSHRYDGIIRQLNNKRIDNSLVKNGYISVKIDKKVIEENKNLNEKEILTYPYIRNTVLYFFAVSAYDTYRPDTKYNHESELSKQITVRPFAGSEID